MNRSCLLAVVLVTPLALVGCESAQYGSELSATPRPRVIDAAGGLSIRLPDEAAFGIVLPESREQPLLNGRSDARSTADKGGSGLASAAVELGGVGEALFRVGHAFQNATAQEVAITCRVSYSYELEISASVATAASDAVAGLRLYVRDKQGRLLRTIPLVDYTSADGAVRRSGSDEVSVDLTLAPGATLNLFVAGQARVDVPEERSARATIALKELKMQLSSK